MTTHQDLILKRLTEVARDAGNRPVDVTTAMNFANTGRLIVSLAANLATVITADFDFQSYRVHLVIDHEGNGMLSGPRDDRHFWWTPGDPKDNDELNRLVSVWRQAIRERTAR